LKNNISVDLENTGSKILHQKQKNDSLDRSLSLKKRTSSIKNKKDLN
jgi:hypothetical protein